MAKNDNIPRDSEIVLDNLTDNIQSFTENSTDSFRASRYQEYSNVILKNLLVGMAIVAPAKTGDIPAFSSGILSRTRRDIAVDENLSEMDILYRRISTAISENNEDFEDGYISHLAHEMMSSYSKDPSAATQALSQIFRSIRKKDQDKAAEILKWLGYLAASRYDHQFVWFLMNSSKHKSHYIRDAAAIALTEYADLVPSDLLKERYESEKVDYIKETLEYAYLRSKDGEVLSKS